tara:strand:+ start:244 stop:534 length:291 start_codon:yes stop_codon:yes gene_type:complete
MADLTVTITLNDTQQAIMNNDLLDIKTWIEDAVSGKQNNCWKRMQTEWTSKLMNDESFTDPIPSNQADFVSLVTGRSDYQTRSERDSGEGERHGTN